MKDFEAFILERHQAIALVLTRFIEPSFQRLTESPSTFGKERSHDAPDSEIL